jgi:hypothetical protein
MSNVRLYFKNQAIRDDGDFLCLTDMWRAGGADANKRPAQWLRLPGTLEFAEYLRDSIVGNSHNTLSRAESGQQGATWAHWQLAMAYAKYLSPEFHAWCNEVVRAVMQGRPPVPAMDQTAIAQIVTHSVLQALAPVLQQTIELARDALTWARDASRRIDFIEQHVATGGRIPAPRWRELQRDIAALAEIEARAELFKSTKASRADIYRELREAVHWGGKRQPWQEMPAANEPAVRHLLRLRRANAERTPPRSPQLSLVRNG